MLESQKAAQRDLLLDIWSAGLTAQLMVVLMVVQKAEGRAVQMVDEWVVAKAVETVGSLDANMAVQLVAEMVC